MIRRITLENYMSHALTVIEPAEGLTVLVGPNNCGKSAVVSALQTLCGEHEGDFMVRHGERVARVTVEFQNPGDETVHTITWQRKAKSPSYTIDGVDVHRTGRGNLPDDLHKLLRMPLIQSVDEKSWFNVHFGLQKEPIFLINNERETATFFSSSSDAERLLEMQRRHKARHTAAKNELKTAEADLKRLDAQLESLSPLEAMAERLDDVEVEHRRLLKGQEQIDRLQRQIERIDRLERETAALRSTSQILSTLAGPPDWADEATLARDLDRLSRGIRLIGLTRQRLAALDPLQPPPTLSDELTADRLLTRLAAAGRQAARARGVLAALAALQEPPPPHDLLPLQKLGHAMKAAERDAARHSATLSALNGLADPPVLAAEAGVDQTCQSWAAAAKRSTDAAAALAAVERQLAEVEKQIVTFVTTNPTCPTCGGLLNADHLMHTEVSHAG